MAPIVDNNQFELPVVETPGKKRRRNADTNPFLSSSFSDQTFNIPSSTPIHNRPVDGSAFENPSFRYGHHNKENYNIFSDSCMEVKSIAELANGTAAGDNPFEVVRKPPMKKKKKNNDFEESCFVNPGLNLQAADKPTVNPFEVVRNEESARRKSEACFVNGALNIKGKDSVGERVNPFEITRPTPVMTSSNEKGSSEGLKGIENPGLEMQTYALAVPFTPSINHRINFQELPASALTPCQMLAKNLVFSPEPSTTTSTTENNLITPKRNLTVTKRKSLSVISEEPLDIGEELDCYQLELENSMNEAKARRQVGGTAGGRTSTSGVKRKTRRSLIDVKHISNLSMKLKQLEDSEDEGVEGVQEVEEGENEELAKVIEESPNDQQQQQVPVQTTFTVVKETTVKDEIRIDITNPDVQFEEVDDFEDEEQDVDLFANPAPFQRAYRKKEDPVEFKQPEPLPDIQQTSNKSSKVKDAIRRSFRKLIHPSKAAGQPQVTDLDEKPKESLISTIRHSLRRKTGSNKPKQLQEEEQEEQTIKEESTEEKVLEMSIIAEAPRAVFRQPATGEYKPISSGVGGGHSAGSTLRSSLRRSTKDVKRHMMKSVFNKKGEEGK